MAEIKVEVSANSSQVFQREEKAKDLPELIQSLKKTQREVNEALTKIVDEKKSQADKGTFKSN